MNNGHFNSHFSGYTEAKMMEVVVTNGAIRRAKLQSKCHHQQNQHPAFYRPDALPIAQPTVNEKVCKISPF